MFMHKTLPQGSAAGFRLKGQECRRIGEKQKARKAWKGNNEREEKQRTK